MTVTQKLEAFSNQFEGDVLIDELHKIIYATDASVYREKPVAVVLPRNENDLKLIIKFAKENKTSIIPRTAGTSLAGQVVGSGIVVDVSKYMTRIIELNKTEMWVKVQPGVVLDELNLFLEPHGLFFGPETSTSSRCMMGGMVGNNSCGSHSILYGSTRDHTVEIKALLSDGSEAVFGALTAAEFEQKCKGDALENKIYRDIYELLSNPDNQEEIRREYPKPEINRRNNGYAIDMLIDSNVFGDNEKPFNFCKLLAGSEGTLAFSTEIKLNLVALPPKAKGIMVAHFNSLDEAFEANLIALKHKPGAVEMIDNKILECTKENIGQQKNRFFLKGNPATLLIIEFERDTEDEIKKIVENMEADMRKAGFGYHFPLVLGEDVGKIWDLRKAGLGLLSNIPGDKKAEAFIEDTAVMPEDLPEYMKEYRTILEKYNLDCVYYAHIGSGELHLRPMLNLKSNEGVELFRTIGHEVARLVKKYQGSMSGEHGDGRLRGEFIPIIIGEHNLELCKKVKQSWDSDNIFNPKKIVDTPRMNTSLRYIADKPTREIKTVFDFSSTKGIQRAAEKCNGSGDCRKTELIGGTMCPSFMATRDEKNATRARANILREYLTRSPKDNPFDHKEIYKVMDLCLSCKACKSECPSSVDVAKLKAEFLQHYYDANGIPLRSRLVANISKINSLGSLFPALFNMFMKFKFISKMIGFTTKRSMPLLSRQTFNKWLKQNLLASQNKNGNKGKVYLFVDEFTNFNDTEVGIKAILLLTKLGYEVAVTPHVESGRTYLSKGLIRKAKENAQKNITIFSKVITDKIPLLGIEPSAILTFRDEYPDLSGEKLKDDALKLAKNSFLIEEFLASEIQKGKIQAESFTDKPRKIKVHGHCQQKAIASTKPIIDVLSLPKNYEVVEIASGCCGMAGSFGYEKEHYDISMKVGELVLFPEVRKSTKETVISAPGTSCRHQIKDGTGRDAYHPVEILYEALI